jgi:hypothetical protein
VPPSALGEVVVDCGNESESITIVADLDLRVPDLAAGCLHAHPLGRSERCLVEVDRGGRVVENEYGVIVRYPSGMGLGFAMSPLRSCGRRSASPHARSWSRTTAVTDCSPDIPRTAALTGAL